MCVCFFASFFFFQAEDGIRDLVRSRGLGDVYKRQDVERLNRVLLLARAGAGPVSRQLLGGYVELSYDPVSYTHLTLPTSDLV